jgi:hypothetical protein
MALLGLAQPRLLHELDEADLGRVVTVPSRRLALRDDARPSLQHRGGMHLAITVEQLRHADFFS